MSAYNSSSTLLVTAGDSLPLLSVDTTDNNLRKSLPQDYTVAAQQKVVESVMSPTTEDQVSILLHEENDGDVDEVKEAPKEMEKIIMPRYIPTEISSTPSIAIAMTPSASRSRSRQRNAQDTEMEAAEPTPRPAHAHLKGRARRKKKRAEKKAAEPALRTIRGFDPTPVASGDEASDTSHQSAFPKLNPVNYASSGASSPYIRPASASGGGISALRQQFRALEVLEDGKDCFPNKYPSIRKINGLPSDTPSETSGSFSDRDCAGMTRYEVALESDFISAEAEAPDPALSRAATMQDTPHRKMSAADFTKITCLGKGAYGTVHLVKQRGTGRLFAQKQFRKASLTVHARLIEQTKTERAILESINRHPFVVKLYYAFQDHQKLYLILEYAQGGELFTHLASERMFPEPTAAFYMAEMVLALDHLHNTVGVLYRDLKPENCLLDAEGHLLLTDFGLSKVSLDGSDARSSSICGTVEYMAPEVILGHFYGCAVDWWSLGVLGFDLLTGASPFRGPNHARTQKNIVRQKLSLPYFLSAEAKDLLTRLLRKDPGKRLGGVMPRDLGTIKKHRFFRNIDWAKLAKREVEPPIRPIVTDPERAENFAAEFTGLALSPGVARHASSFEDWPREEEVKDVFGGFSFVASESMLDGGGVWGDEGFGGEYEYHETDTHGVVGGLGAKLGGDQALEAALMEGEKLRKSNLSWHWMDEPVPSPGDSDFEEGWAVERQDAEAAVAVAAAVEAPAKEGVVG